MIVTCVGALNTPLMCTAHHHCWRKRKSQINSEDFEKKVTNVTNLKLYFHENNSQYYKNKAIITEITSQF